jgi:alpha-beta hydrolase superfamily lysophospholipase
MKPGDVAFQSPDGARIFVYRWLPDDESRIRAAVQIAHGMAEHAARYAGFAEALCAAGFAVYANDHRGHGKTAGVLEQVGYFGDDGWPRVVADIHQLSRIIRDTHPGLPLFLFGHSMGSLLARSYILEHGAGLKGVVLSGIPADPGLLGKIGLPLARLVALLKGARTPSPFLNRMSFGKFNQPFKPNRTEFDWLSRDEAVVDAYVADPYCGGVFSAGFFVDLLTGMNGLSRRAEMDRIPKDLPILIFSGDMDPCGGMTKGVRPIYDSYKRAGITDLTLRFYSQGRHEMLNETNREEVIGDVVSWLNQHL